MSTREIPKQEQLLNLFKVNKDTKTTPFTYFWTASFTSFYCLYDCLWADLMFCFGVSVGDFKQANTAEKTTNSVINLFLLELTHCFKKWIYWNSPTLRVYGKISFVKQEMGHIPCTFSRTVKKVWSVKLEISKFCFWY